MAGEYLIKVKAVIDKQDAKELQDDLTDRFDSVADKFNASLKRGIKRLALSGLILGAISKVMNDVDNANSTIDEMLDKARELRGDSAAQGLLPAEYWKLSRLSNLAGVENFNGLFNAFRETLEKTNRGFNTPLNQFRGQSANAETFLQLLSSLQAAHPKDRQLAARSIFGDSGYQDVNKLLTSDLAYLAEKAFKGINDDVFNEAIAKNIVAGQQQMVQDIRREYSNLQNRSTLISPDLIRSQGAYRDQQDRLTDEYLKAYDVTVTIQQKMLEGQTLVVEGVNKGANILSNIWTELKDIKARMRDDQEVAAGRMTEQEYYNKYGEVYGDRW